MLAHIYVQKWQSAQHWVTMNVCTYLVYVCNVPVHLTRLNCQRKIRGTNNSRAILKKHAILKRKQCVHHIESSNDSKKNNFVYCANDWMHCLISRCHIWHSMTFIQSYLLWVNHMLRIEWIFFWKKGDNSTVQLRRRKKSGKLLLIWISMHRRYKQ